jgi:putative Ca2+/H+ antiporter (TMEM165/GDT1 family)
MLNLLAVLFGAAAARWLPEQLVVLLVGILFLSFGIHSIRNHGEEDDEEIQEERAGHGIFFSTLLLITLAEFGDKTQIAVAGLGSTAQPVAVWLGATLALALTSGLGVWAGRTVLQRLPLTTLHRVSGVFFIVLGLAALYTLI